MTSYAVQCWKYGAIETVSRDSLESALELCKFGIQAATFYPDCVQKITEFGEDGGDEVVAMTMEDIECELAYAIPKAAFNKARNFHLPAQILLTIEPPATKLPQTPGTIDILGNSEELGRA